MILVTLSVLAKKSICIWWKSQEYEPGRTGNRAKSVKSDKNNDYTYTEWDDSLVCSLMREVFNHDVTLTPALLGEIRDFATQNPSDDSDVTLRMLDEYNKKRHRVAVSI
ncbi:hypothetical protein [Mobiluncus mulieris]|nr:hypothetical protein [Mobiluncus mulieris]